MEFVNHFRVEADCSDAVNLPAADMIRHYMDLFELNRSDAILKIKELDDLMPAKETKSEARPAEAYLVLLGGTLSGPEVLQEIGKLAEPPEIVIGTDDSGEQTEFCRVDHQTKTAVLTHFQEKDMGRPPTFLQLTKADKSLSSASLAPTLGQDATMPQNRAESDNYVFSPAQDEHPVLYFLYGPLAEASELSMILRLDKDPEYIDAMAHGGRWLSPNAMSDGEFGEQDSLLPGKALLVKTKTEEDSMRFSVTDKFEVVRCKMTIVATGELVYGLTFRYVGTDLE